MAMKTFAILPALAIALAAAQGPKTHRSFLGEAPPELVIPEEGWLNAATPLTLESLRGRVVWLEFSFST